jgi:hypothetical protein
VKQRRAALLIAGLVTAGGAVTSAMTYVSVDFPTLVGNAHAIAIGHVVAAQPRWREGRRGIETALTFEVERYLKGDLGRTVTLAVPGGQMGRYRSIMPGGPVIVENEELVLFMMSDAPGAAHLLGLGQGVFRIMTDGATGARIVVPEVLTIVSTGSTKVVRGDPTRRPLPLEQFAAAVHSALSSQAGR